MYPNKDIVDQIKIIRKQKGITQVELAKLTGLKQAAIARIENHHMSPTINMLNRILDALGMALTIENYKKISLKYKIGGKNGKGRVYKLNTNILLFEGEYLNGIKNGKGKEYNENGILLFEGEYLNGKRWNGKIKDYDYHCKLEFEGYKVIGLINIPAINLKYPILEKTTQETMKISISKYWGGDINSLGNVSLAGHNNKITLTMFGKNKNLKNVDRVFLTDLTGNTIEYEIYDKFITDPDDITILQTKDNTIREVTLITCTNGRENRLIIKAKEVK